MKKPKPRKNHKLGTFELWISVDPNGHTNIFIVKENGQTEFGYSNGSWDEKHWDRRGTSWGFEFAGYL